MCKEVAVRVLYLNFCYKTALNCMVFINIHKYSVILVKIHNFFIKSD